MSTTQQVNISQPKLRSEKIDDDDDNNNNKNREDEIIIIIIIRLPFCGANKYKLTELSPTTNQTL